MAWHACLEDDFVKLFHLNDSRSTSILNFWIFTSDNKQAKGKRITVPTYLILELVHKTEFFRIHYACWENLS